jgi:ferredoxin
MSSKSSLKTVGAHSLEELSDAGALPSREEMARKSCVCIECIEEIPCNPCETSCPTGALTVGEPITRLPLIDRGKCTACGLCIPACPGLAIWIKSVKGEKAQIRFPWEYLPYPATGEEVEMANRLGETICKGTVRSVSVPARNDRTAVVTAEFPAEFVDEVVTMRRKNEAV